MNATTNPDVLNAPARATASSTARPRLSARQAKTLRLALIYLACGVVLFWALAPIYWVFVSSISTRVELYSTPYKHWFPQEPTFQNYIDIFTTGPKYRDGGFMPTATKMSSGTRNSLVMSVVTASAVTLIATYAGYVFARLRFRFKQAVFYYLMLMMPLPIWVSLIALYFIMAQLKLLDTLLGLILILGTLHLPLSIWLMTTFVRELPREIEDAAFVDGCTRWQALHKIVFPLARPGMSAVFLVTLLTTWNAFLIPMIFTSSESAQPMTVVLTLFIGQNEIAWESMSAAAVVTMVPPILLALFFQRYLVRGLTMGAVNE